MIPTFCLNFVISGFCLDLIMSSFHEYFMISTFCLDLMIPAFFEDFMITTFYEDFMIPAFCLDFLILSFFLLSQRATRCWLGCWYWCQSKQVLRHLFALLLLSHSWGWRWRNSRETVVLLLLLMVHRLSQSAGVDWVGGELVPLPGCSGNCSLPSSCHTQLIHLHCAVMHCTVVLHSAMHKLWSYSATHNSGKTIWSAASAVSYSCNPRWTTCM